MPASSTTLRVVMYSHDTFGLGHITRTLRLARAVTEAVPTSSVLVLTGSPIAHRLTFPPGVEYVKLPSVRKNGPESYAARDLGIPFWRLRHLRMQMLRDAVRIVRPHVLFVDNVPLGMKGEMLPALEIVSARRHLGARIHLNLRDIVDEPEVVRETWRGNGASDALRAYYDEIHVFGDACINDAVEAYDLPPRITTYLGYLAPATASIDPEPVREAWSRGLPRVLVTIGGGDDGVENVRAAIAAHRQDGSSYALDVVLGPMFDRAARAELLSDLRSGDDIRVRDYVPDLATAMGQYDAVLSMGGYNTLCEVMARARRSIVIPRVVPRREQEIRAMALARRGVVRVVRPDESSPERLSAEIAASLAYGPELPSPHAPPLDGLKRFRARMAEIAAEVGGRAARHHPESPTRETPKRRVARATLGLLLVGLAVVGLTVAHPASSRAGLLPSEARVDLIGGYDSNVLNASDAEVRAFESHDSNAFFVVDRMRDAMTALSLQSLWPLPRIGKETDLRLGYSRLQYLHEAIRAENQYSARLRTRLGPRTTANLSLAAGPRLYGRHREDKDALPGDPIFRPEIRNEWEGGIVLERDVAAGWLSRVGAEVSYRDYNQPFNERDKWRVGGLGGLVWRTSERVRLELIAGYRRARSRNAPDLGSDLSNTEWSLRWGIECARSLGGQARLHAQIRRDWTRFTSAIPTDLSHYGREEADWEVAAMLQQPITRALDWRASLVYAWRPPAGGLARGDVVDDEGASHDALVTTGLSWHWSR